jgi:hypothetical protein
LNSVVVGGGGGGEARNTNIAADSLGVRDVRGSITVGSLGTAIDTTIALGAGNDRLIRVYGPDKQLYSSCCGYDSDNNYQCVDCPGATNTNIVNNNVASPVNIEVFGTPTGTTCNGNALGGVNPCSCPGTC